MSESPDDIVGHKTFATGERAEYGMPVHRHEPLTRAEGEALWRHAQRCHEDRVARMPDEKSALQALHDAYGDPRDLERAIAIRDALKYPTEKPAAMVSIDDRALCFTGNWNDFDPQRLLEFKPWNKSPSLGSTISVSRNANLIRRIQTALMLIFAPGRTRGAA